MPCSKLEWIMNVYFGERMSLFPIGPRFALYVPVHPTGGLFGIYSIEADVQVLG